jgi:hypothetical protein
MSEIFPKGIIHPIIIPVNMFTDRFGNANSYLEMNPSLYMEPLEEDGSVIILVRTVNYNKYKSNSFTMNEYHSNSIYYILRGCMRKGRLNLDTFTISPLEYSYSMSTYDTYWKGLEDIRFIDNTNVLVTIPECNPSGKPCIFKAELSESSLSNFSVCLPNKIEKNWMPYGKGMVIYSLQPFRIKELEKDTIQILDITDSRLVGYNGSTNGIVWGDNEYLFLIHGNRDKVYHRWIVFNEKTATIKVSSEFVFFKHSYIEFPCSLQKLNTTLYVSLGINDNKAFIVEVNMHDVNKWFV